MLVDWQIEEARLMKRLKISPWKANRVQPASYDVALGPTIRVMEEGTWLNVFNGDDPAQAHGPWTWPRSYSREEKAEGFILKPGQFILASTAERIELAPTLAARVEGKSSLGRLGLMVHITAGFIDPGFEGEITLEIYNAAPWEFPMEPGMLIGQLCFFDVARPRYDYGATGRYQGQTGPQESRYSHRG